MKFLNTLLPLRGILAVCFACAAGTVTAATITDTLSSLSLGAPFPKLPLCADVRTPDGERFTALCAEPSRSDRSVIALGFPPQQRPDILDGNRAVAVLDGATLVGLVIPTQGAKADARVLAALRKAFGEPMRIEQEQVVSTGGRFVSATHAGWIKGAMTVEMYAIPDQPDTGTVELLLDAARPLMGAPAPVASAPTPGAPTSRQGW
jgi:hypothetical protein